MRKASLSYFKRSAQTVRLRPLQVQVPWFLPMIQLSLLLPDLVLKSCDCCSNPRDFRWCWDRKLLTNQSWQLVSVLDRDLLLLRPYCDFVKFNSVDWKKDFHQAKSSYFWDTSRCVSSFLCCNLRESPRLPAVASCPVCGTWHRWCTASRTVV